MNHLIIAEHDGQIIASWRPEAQPAWAASPVEFTSPFSPRQREDLKWYLEEYLRAPYGVWADQGEAIASALPAWGESLFNAVFGPGNPARDAYQLARDLCRNCVIEFQSASPAFLALPWELMVDPGTSEPIALEFAGFLRSVPITEKTFELPKAHALRVLLVISRPSGDRDLSHQIVARPLMKRLAAVSGQVDLDVLRPPTFGKLKQALSRAREEGQPYQIVHFDGHGDFDGFGFLVFEAEDRVGRLVGKRVKVSAESFGAELAKAEVPLVILNACRSAQLSEDAGPEAVVATRLLQGGAAAVVAMSHSIYGVAAAEFMATLYADLFAGRSLGRAMAAGRSQLRCVSGRPSPKGVLPLADWCVPVLYSRTEVSFPHLVRSRPEAHIGGSLGSLRVPARPSELDGVPDPDSIEPYEPFFGRDREFLRLETLMLDRPVVVLHGSAGTGKTELAKAFARWWRDTSGTDSLDGVFFHSFEPGLANFGIDGVVAAVGSRVLGMEFLQLLPDQRRITLLDTMARTRLLFVWDNFETVVSMPDPDGVTPPLDEAGRMAVSSFLARVLRDHCSAIIITSRSPENWLGDDIARLQIEGISPEDADRYADVLLQDVATATIRRAADDFPKLMEYLDGHPLALRLTLPRLDRHPAATLHAQLLGEIALADPADDGRTRSLAASIAYSLRHLAPEHLRLLPALSLIERVVDANLLGAFSDEVGVPSRFRAIEARAWADCLNAAGDLGLLTSLGQGLWRIHPALPASLAATWRSAAGESFAVEHEAALNAFGSAMADYCSWLLAEVRTGNSGLAFAILLAHRHNLSRCLDHALRKRRWGMAQLIFQPLNELWNAAGLVVESEGWGDRATAALEQATEGLPNLADDAGLLWLFLVGTKAGRARTAKDRDVAAVAFDNLRLRLEQNDRKATRPVLAVAYHQLGLVAQNRGHLAEAESWYRKALAIRVRLGNQSDVASTYHQLGMVAEDQGELSSAESCYRKSVTIKKKIGNRPGLAASYNQLGSVAKARGDLLAAERWYRQALVIFDELNNHPAMASIFGNLGIVAKERGDLDVAESLYRKALDIFERLCDLPGMASTYSNLGIVAQDRGALGTAEAWHRKSLAIETDLGNNPGIASSYHQLGMVEQERGDLAAAETWYRNSLTLAQDLGDRPSIAATYHQLGLIAEMRHDPTAAEDWYGKSLSVEEELGNPIGMALSYGNLAVLALQRCQFLSAIDRAVRASALVDDFCLAAAGNTRRQLALCTLLAGWPALEQAWLRIIGSNLPANVRATLPAVMAEVKSLADQIAADCAEMRGR